MMRVGVGESKGGAEWDEDSEDEESGMRESGGDERGKLVQI